MFTFAFAPTSASRFTPKIYANACSNVMATLSQTFTATLAFKLMVMSTFAPTSASRFTLQIFPTSPTTIAFPATLLSVIASVLTSALAATSWLHFLLHLQPRLCRFLQHAYVYYDIGSYACAGIYLYHNICIQIYGYTCI